MILSVQQNIPNTEESSSKKSIVYITADIQETYQRDDKAI